MSEQSIARQRRMHTGMGVAFALALAACGPDGTKGKEDIPEIAEDIETSVLEESTGSVASESDAETLTTQLLGGSGASLNLASENDLSLQGLGDGAKALFVPAGCLTTEHNAAAKRVTYTFKGCFGGQGLGMVNGVLSVTYNNTEPNRLLLTMSADNFRIRRSVFTFNAASDTTATGATRTIKWTASLSGTTGAGKAFERSNQKVLSFAIGEQCLSVDGLSTGKVGNKSVRFEIAKFRRCRGQCPEPGGTIKVTDEDKGKSATLTFGNGTAEYTTSGGKKKSVALACSENN
jgi:hypothetical protein